MYNSSLFFSVISVWFNYMYTVNVFVCLRERERVSWKNSATNLKKDNLTKFQYYFPLLWFNLKDVIIFDSGNAVLGEAFTHTPPTQKMDKKSRQKAESSFTVCFEILFSIWTNSSRLFVCALHKQNKQTKSRQ